LKLHKKPVFLPKIKLIMKKIFFIIATLNLIVVSVSCKAKQEAATSTNTSTSEVKAEKFRLVVSFISKGAGPDREKTTALLAFVEAHAKKPSYKAEHWGREGESDYCFHLTELSKSEQADFVASITKLMAGSDMVFIKENAEVNHKKR
jgi:hypothetical protein